MGTFFTYSLQSAICIIIFYLFYKVLLSRETFHRFNRVALISILAISLLLPFIHLNIDFSKKTSLATEATTNANKLEETNTNIFDSYTFTPDNIQTNTKNIFNILLLIYIVGCIISLLFTIISITRIIHIIKGGKQSKIENKITIVIHPDNRISPFSWLNYIVISENDYKEAGDTIITHETAHIRLHHTYDLLATQICLIVQWFNPAAWLLYQELQNIHEYEADEAVLSHGIDARQYQLFLIKKAVGSRLYSMANNFNHSNLKKRITMMLQKKSNSWARLKYAYVLPLAAITVAAFASPEISKQFDEISSAKISNFALNTSKNEVKNLQETNVYAKSPNDAEFKGMTMPEDTTIVKKKSVDSLSNYKNIPILANWIKKYIKAPKYAENKNIQGYGYILAYTIETDGSISNASLTDFGATWKHETGDSISNVKITHGNKQEVTDEAFLALKSILKFQPQPTRISTMYVIPMPPMPSLKKIKGPIETATSIPKSYQTDKYTYITVEEMPEFPDGEEALLKWISNHIKYPENAAKNNVQGRVAIQFIVEKDGSVTNPQVLKSVNPELDAEAIRVIGSLPKFIPGKQEGKLARVKYSVPVRFKLPKKNTAKTNSTNK